MLLWIALIIGVLVVAGLSIYAGILLSRLRQQNKGIAKNQKKRLNYLHESIETIAKAMQQDQCPLSEGCIRIAVLLDNLPDAERHNFGKRWPSIHELYERIKHMPTHDARKEFPKKEIRKMDFERERFEVELEQPIKEDLQALMVWVKEERVKHG
ncbi:DUF2489 domain-containing protein [Aliidiomarina iranensis]|uniref:DUF2489 domain-containing protein n=1 Tax=Aliidiomarina iranensis TaxID=1434071 RepID=A0A432W1S1_9GAMM|nr:DUF2489 domain-containing protein [Aliidiomarina iranensis]RUO23172.1 DUF2489 domain-containing protein [Aliidiomarina iranensis]